MVVCARSRPNVCFSMPHPTLYVLYAQLIFEGVLPGKNPGVFYSNLGVPTNIGAQGIVNFMTDSTRLAVGDTAPAFTLQDHTGKMVSLADYSGKRVLVYFYPRANTPGCTKEACDFRDSLADFRGLDIDVIGISPDSPEKLTVFRSDHDLNFTLLSDPDKEVMKAWGAFGEKKNYGKIVQGVIRSTFLIGADGTIEQAMYNVRATGHVARVLREVE